ncbi:hypothetical protein SBA4_70031 [Candidatus Sulfopaludibacter sp. SbA4]|nr:hypothetical protein SBA4_70031 [Candidatus Sulfopaludibacter sp. SbA4]
MLNPGLLEARGCTSASFGLCFQAFQIRVKLVFGYSFSTVEFLESSIDFRVDFLTICGEPFILLAQNFQRPVDHFLGSLISAGAQSFSNSMLLLRA